MSRVSRDQIEAGRVWNGFDYQLQVWVKDGIVQDVGNRPDLVGRNIFTIPDAEVREEGGAHHFNQYTPSDRYCGTCGIRNEDYHDRMIRTL